jgi:sigma-B regulation protein RsbU (phosphoserine phosphatase)
MKLMPRPEDLPQAKFQVCLRQVLAAGGDFYDVIPASHGLVDYLVADASGHDLASSFWTAALKALAAEYAGPIHLPLEIVSAINGTLCRVLPSGAFFTLIYASLNHQTGRLALVSAAHPPLILVHSGGSRVNIVRLEGDVVGAFQNAVFGFTELTIQPGDRMFLYSDGLIETGGSHEEGINRLAEACLNRRSLPPAEPRSTTPSFWGSNDETLSPPISAEPSLRHRVPLDGGGQPVPEHPDAAPGGRSDGGVFRGRVAGAGESE